MFSCPASKLRTQAPKALLFLLVSVIAIAASGQNSSIPAPTPPTAMEDLSDVPTAPVIVDGETLFRVRGVSAYPAEKRAAKIAEAVEAVARDRSFLTKDLREIETAYSTQIFAGDRFIANVFDSDAQLENVHRQVLAHAYAGQIKEAIEAYRHDRHPKVLAQRSTYAIIAAVVLVIILAVGFGVARRLRRSLERRYRDRIPGVEIQALQIIHAAKLWKLLLGLLTVAEVVLGLLAVYATTYYILSLFPWTRVISLHLFGFVLDPLRTMGRALLAAIPDLIFLLILTVITAYVLKLIKLVFKSVETGAVTVTGFEPEWAKPTFRLVRVLVIAFALVVAFPYIPGSNTQAFKGLSLFVGVVFSLGSTSLIANLISGYSLTYRRVFKVGDRVKIGSTIGYVEKSGPIVTFLRSIKNETVIVPNMQIINNEVINFTALAKKAGLILHTEVGIGYETPWRQVEAMLNEAAARTPGLLRDPKPFVLQKALGDFAIVYEINAYCDTAKDLEGIYSSLHENILDVFNEYSVQIMTPAYMHDPDQPKIVPKEQWYAAPAGVASAGSSGSK